MIFYIFVASVSVIALMADMILRYMEKIRSFGMEGRIHNIKGKIIPVEDFIPHNMTLVSLFFVAFGTVGILLKLLSLNGLIVFPICVISGMLTNFTAVRILKRIRIKPLPRNADFSGIICICTETVKGDGYGSVSFTYEEQDYVLPALSENETDIIKGEKAVIILINEGVCIVEKESEILDILNEK